MTQPLVQLAYSLPSFAAAVDMSVDALRKQIDLGNLVPSYPNSKPLITREEGERWLKSLPSEKRTA